MAFFQFIFFLTIFAVGTFGRPFTSSSDNEVIIEQLISNGIPIENNDADDDSTISGLKIVGGDPAPPHSAPWIISLQLYVERQARWFHICGGAILSPEWILTAGHCLHGLDSQTIEVVAGAHDLAANESWSQQRRAVQKRVVYPRYQGGVAPYDIGLVRMTKPLQLTTSVQTIQLPSDTNVLPRGYATLYGWGSTSRTNKPQLPKTLQMMTVPIVNADVCSAILNAGRTGLISNELTVCTGPLEGTPSACNGDSGSALTQGHSVIGVVSWGRSPCGLVNSASVYTRVSTYKNWIRRTMSIPFNWSQ